MSGPGSTDPRSIPAIERAAVRSGQSVTDSDCNERQSGARSRSSSSHRGVGRRRQDPGARRHEAPSFMLFVIGLVCCAMGRNCDAIVIAAGLFRGARREPRRDREHGRGGRPLLAIHASLPRRADRRCHLKRSVDRGHDQPLHRRDAKLSLAKPIDAGTARWIERWQQCAATGTQRVASCLALAS